MNYYLNNAMRLKGDLMSRGKEVKELREKMGMNRREFSDYYGIPYRTVQDWEAEKRELPEYLLRLMKYRAEVEYMMKVGEVKMKRKVNVIEDLDGKKTVFIHDILFKGKRAVKWDEVEKYLRQYVGDICTIDDSNEVIYIGADLPDEYAHSNYTHILKGANAKAKANAAQGLPELIKIADGKKFTENYKVKHNVDAGKNIRQLINHFNLNLPTDGRLSMKAIAEKIVIAMFGGTVKKLNQIELFEQFGLIAKTITFTSKGGRTEDMKLYHIDFGEMIKETVIDDDGTKRAMTFEDSDMYAYFADHAFLCIMFQEASRDSETEYKPNSLSSNVFIGFKRIVFSDEFIDTKVRKLWEDTRDKIMHHKLTDVVQKRSDGSTVTLKSGKVSTAPNFLKGSENDVFVRGSGKDSSIQSKTECVNGIRMLPQYVWIKGLSVVEELKKTPEI